MSNKIWGNMKTVLIYTKEYYSAVKKSKMMISVGIWIEYEKSYNEQSYSFLKRNMPNILLDM